MKFRAPVRFLILLIAIAAVLGIATASTSPEHFHARQPAKGCDICFTAHFAALEAKAIAAAPQTPQSFGSVTFGPAVSGYRLFRSKASRTRGPPSLI